MFDSSQQTRVNLMRADLAACQQMAKKLGWPEAAKTRKTKLVHRIVREWLLQAERATFPDTDARCAALEARILAMEERVK